MNLKNLCLAFVLSLTSASAYMLEQSSVEGQGFPALKKLVLQDLCGEDAHCQLEAELITLLTKHGYGQRDFLNGFFNPRRRGRVPNTVFYEGLKKFKTALEKTKYVRDFSHIGTLYISDRETAYISTIKFAGKFSLYFPAYEPAEAYIGLLSSAPEREPEYQKYLQKKRVEFDQKLEPKFGQWFAFHKTGEQILCGHHKGTENPDTVTIREVAEELLGEQVQGIEFERSDYQHRDGHKRILQIQIDSLLLSKIIVETSTDEEGEEERFFIKIKNPEGDNLIESTYDLRCNFKNARTWKYREHKGQNLLWERQWINAKGEVNRTVYANREEQTLENIYQSGQYERPYPELEFISQRTDRVLVTILDSGVDYNHPDLAYKILRTPEGRIIGRDYQDFDDLPYDYDDYLFNIWESFDHGTHVAGIITKGSDDIAILPIRYPKTEREKFYDAVIFAFEQGSRIVNISLGSDEKEYWESLNQAIGDHPNMLFFIAAGNDELNLNQTLIYPVAFDHPNMIVVASVDEYGRLSDLSNYSPIKVDVAAPGEDILSLEPQSSRGEKSGTSMATPYVTRIAAKISFINPALGPEEIIGIIRDSTTPVAELADKVKYGGVANEARALELARETLKQ